MSLEFQGISKSMVEKELALGITMEGREDTPGGQAERALYWRERPTSAEERGGTWVVCFKNGT